MGERKILGLYRLRERAKRTMYELTMPLEWVRDKKLRAGDKLVIMQNERGELVIRRP